MKGETRFVFGHMFPQSLSNPLHLRRRAAFLMKLSSGTYLSQSKVQVYLNDALNVLLKVTSHQSNSPLTSPAFSASSRPLRFLSNYFEGVLDEVRWSKERRQ